MQSISSGKPIPTSTYEQAPLSRHPAAGLLFTHSQLPFTCMAQTKARKPNTKPSHEQPVDTVETKASCKRKNSSSDFMKGDPLSDTKHAKRRKLLGPAYSAKASTMAGMPVEIPLHRSAPLSKAQDKNAGDIEGAIEAQPLAEPGNVFRFIDLPRVLRDNIYDKVFEDNRFTFHWNSLEVHAIYGDATYARHRPAKKLLTWLLVSPQILDEAMEQFIRCAKPIIDDKSIGFIVLKPPSC
ncbi:hypothetical protein K469DRAFT_106390 [Zopfia rhizophila CBS 207.26]|uniref:Uncharacterized protein n=1 Tax=Zopfia rhizophila CBS 207.26 TaxID=1314779 RepID=A0A6A6EB36_9PEZI|nr:hypothetical protein K469DRAFT_106390 [Zopfia rhizophila CBS 207.26]